jgi:hypothetical protein
MFILHYTYKLRCDFRKYLKQYLYGCIFMQLPRILFSAGVDSKTTLCLEKVPVTPQRYRITPEFITPFRERQKGARIIIESDNI